MKTINKSAIKIVSVLTTVILSACGGSHDSPSNTQSAAQRATSQSPHKITQLSTTAPSCAQMTGISISAALIGLPSSGAVVTSSSLVAAGTQQLYTVGEYCRVYGDIMPVDPLAPPIQFQLNLPTQWNHKAMMFGGGGYNGDLATIPSGTGNTPVSAADHPSPLSRGYATFGSDSGHVSQPPFTFGRDASFAVNDEALNNYTGDALKKTRDTALYLINLFYQSAPQKIYFQGGSTGGREAISVVQRWPQDFDGAIALFPASNAATMTLQMGRISRAFAQPGAYLNSAKRQLLLKTSIANCDQYDNVLDGIISNVAACNAHFDPATATIDGLPNGPTLRCTGGVDLGDGCLSDAQIAALRVYASPMLLSYPLASGETQHPGYNVWGADIGIPSNDPNLALNLLLGLSLDQPASPVTTDMPYMTAFYDQWMKYFVTRDANFDGLAVDPQAPGIWQARISALSALQDKNKTDLQAFKQRGGKLIIMHGLADALVSSQSTAQYFQRLEQTMGKGKVKKFARYYQVPGYGHASSPTFNATFDVVSALEQWAEAGIKPKNLITTDISGVPGRTRPLCDFPKWPKYKGNGNQDLASSFVCISGNGGNGGNGDNAEEDEDD